MKIRLLICFIIYSASLQAQEMTVEADIKKTFLEKWDNSEQYLIALIERMPDSLMTYRPTSRQMSFEEQLGHIKGNIDWLTTTYFEVPHAKLPPATEDVVTFDKTVYITKLRESFQRTRERLQTLPEDALMTEVDFFAGPKSRLQILNLLHDHITHHRGQLVVYLNLNDITPPDYIGW